MTNKYFEKMYEVNPQYWKLEAAIVNEYVGETQDGRSDYELVKYYGDMDIDTAVSHYTGKCQHCNHRHIHFVIMSNVENGDIISIGWDCYNETFSHNTRQELDLARAKKVAERAVRRIQIAKEAMAYEAAHKELFDFMVARMERNSFYNSLVRAIADYGSLTERQEAAAYKAMERDYERELAKANEPAALPAPQGERIVVEGKIVGFKSVKNEYAYNSWIEKMTVKHADGWRVFCTLPSSISHAKEGDTVRFTVNLEQARNDETMAWGKRPTKAEIIE